MARKAKHDQQSLPDTGFVCTNCAGDECVSCIDVTRFRIGAVDSMCMCRRKHHVRLGEQ